jgi:hypothetical protein
VIKIQKKIVVNERGEPKEAIIPWKQFCEIAEALDLRQGKSEAFLPLSKV